MKRTPSPRPAWIRTCSITHASGNVIDFPDRPGSCVAALGREPRLHRSQPVVCAVRRRGPPGLPAFRSRSRSPAPAFEHVLETALRRARSARGAGDSVLTRKPPGRAVFTSTFRSCAARCRSRSGPSPRASPSAWRPPSRADHRRIPRRQAPRRTRAGRLQPERLGTHTRVGLFRPPAPQATVSTPVTWDEIERGFRIEDFRIDNVPERVTRSAISGSRCSLARGRVDLERVL